MRERFRRYSPAAPWLAFFALVLAAWAALFAMQPEAVAVPAGIGGRIWAALCTPVTGQSAYGAVFAMWALMSAAMMAPTFVPALRTYHGLTHTEAANGRSFMALLGGYLAVWIGFAALAAGAQLGLARAALLDSAGAAAGWGLTSVLLGVAGLYQFSTLKEACLSECRAPMMFFMEHWRPGLGGALAMGLRLGAVCVGCCWALMTLGFVGGVMNLVWMGLATFLMTLEKLPEIGRVVTRPLGVILLAGATFAGLQALGML